MIYHKTILTVDPSARDDLNFKYFINNVANPFGDNTKTIDQIDPESEYPKNGRTLNTHDFKNKLINPLTANTPGTLTRVWATKELADEYIKKVNSVPILGISIVYSGTIDIPQEEIDKEFTDFLHVKSSLFAI